MSMWRRLWALISGRSNQMLERAEDPRLSLDEAYRRQLELLGQVRRGLVEVASARKRIELEGAELVATGQRLEDQARQALAANREDLARQALARRAALDAHLADLRAQHDRLTQDEERLVESATRFQERVDAFRIQKETLKATYTAADAQVRVRETLSGVSDEMSDLGQAVSRAQERTAQLRARAAAIDDLLTSGALDDLSQPSDRIQAELDRVAIDASVEGELTRLRGELTGGGLPALEGPKSAARGE